MSGSTPLKSWPRAGPKGRRFAPCVGEGGRTAGACDAPIGVAPLHVGVGILGPAPRCALA